MQTNYQTNILTKSALKFSEFISERKAKISKQAKHQKLKQTKKTKILVVEDEPISQHVARQLLELKGYQVDIATTGQEALDLFKSNVYAAILMDLGLPDMPGTEVTRKIRAIELELDLHIPIIALTAHGILAKTECLAAGINDFSSKPLELAELNTLLKKWVARSEPNNC